MLIRREKLDHSYISGGNLKSCGHSGNIVAVSYKTKYAIIKNPDIAVMAFIPEKWKLMFTQNLNANVYGSFRIAKTGNN